MPSIRRSASIDVPPASPSSATRAAGPDAPWPATLAIASCIRSATASESAPNAFSVV